MMKKQPDSVHVKTLHILNAHKADRIAETDMGLGTCDIKCIRVNYPHPGKYLTKI